MMKSVGAQMTRWLRFSFVLVIAAPSLVGCDKAPADQVTVPFTLDHNRMLVEGEIMGSDSLWHPARLWVDTGNPEFFLSEPMAKTMGVEGLDALDQAAGGAINISSPAGLRLGGMELDLAGVSTKVLRHPGWLFSTMHNDANLPATVLCRYQIVFDYPAGRLTIGQPGTLEPRGTVSPAHVHPETGIVQIDGVIDGDSLSLALDNGASYSFLSGDVVERLRERNPQWPVMTGTLGCANMWGWWPPQEQTLPVLRIPAVRWGNTQLDNLAVVGVAEMAPGGPSLGAWYSHKTARPVDGFLGPNALCGYRVQIDYAAETVCFEKGAETPPPDLDIVGISLRPEPDSTYTVLGVAEWEGAPAVAEVLPGDTLLRVDDLAVTGRTMGTVVDALRGAPGDTHQLQLTRDGRTFAVTATVRRFL